MMMMMMMMVVVVVVIALYLDIPQRSIRQISTPISA
jgi:hypothetical protein